MSWHVLHAGKFVDADGVVLDRAEHEFLARSKDFPESLIRLIARQEPVPRKPPVEWRLPGKPMAAFTQTSVRLDGVDHCLRVIDHQAFEGPADRPGRAYRKRTYLLKAIDDWVPEDVLLPLDLVQQPPQYQEPTECPRWVPGEPTEVDTAQMKMDVGILLGTGRLGIERPDRAGLQRITTILAALPPIVAARLSIHIGDGDGTIRCPAPTDGEPLAIGNAIVTILGRSKKLLTLATASARPWTFAKAQWDLARPFDEIREELAWVLACEAWLIQVDKALASGRRPPSPDLPPSERLLKAALGLFIDRDAIDRLGVLAGDEWRAAWQRMEQPAWSAVIDLLAQRPLEGQQLTVLAALPLQEEVADLAADAWTNALGDIRHDAIVALLRSPQEWARTYVKANEHAIVIAALHRLCQHRAPKDTWAGHPLRQMPAGKAIDAVLDGEPISAVRSKTLKSMAPAACDAIAVLGDAAANASIHAITGTAGKPAPTTPPGLAATLDWLAGRQVKAADGMIDDWAGFDATVEVTASLRQGVPPAVLEACLARDASRVTIDDDAQAVHALLAQGDRVERNAWAGRDGAWRLLDADQRDPGALAPILDGLQGQDALAALCLYTGDVRPAWAAIHATEVYAWLRDGRPLRPLPPLASAGAAEAIASALSAWLETGETRNPHGVPASVRNEAQQMLDRVASGLGWRQRGRMRRTAKRLEAA